MHIPTHIPQQPSQISQLASLKVSQLMSQAMMT